MNFMICADRMDANLNKQQRMAERQKNMQNKLKMTLENEANQKVFVYGCSFAVYPLFLLSSMQIMKFMKISD